MNSVLYRRMSPPFSIRVLTAIFLFSITLLAQEVTQKTIKEAAVDVAGQQGSALIKTQRIVDWMHKNFEWSYTDYQNRTVREIIQRGAGNCAEQGRVLAAMLKALDIPTRRIREINIHPRSERRRKSAAKLIAERGNRLSVFGYMHNDHFWLEVYDDSNRTWFPADPSVGIIGMEAWFAARIKFDDRILVTDITEEMLVPFMVIVFENGKVIENRSEYYLVQAFDTFYEYKLGVLSDWDEWRQLVRKLSRLGAAAFAGEENLHFHTHLMERFFNVYNQLKEEYN